ncbi:eukaryotic translation initiation factor 4E type 2 [Ceratobasidium sp. AG-Ba]|nr:eukaryotic translation initiation factor 4E type 2 [Ceratobasidium sp. AG-Ba]QRW10923.1 eukaryotic translation initiation factor 4E type 2 [Ceratobasidium sp. AG-Ba]
MNITPSTSTGSASSRPRLATSLLRTNSQTNNSNSQPDSGPTSSVSERAPFDLPAVSVSDPNGEDVSTKEKDKGAPMPRGYKNVPSLDAIAGRLKAREREAEKDKDKDKDGKSEDLEPGEIVDEAATGGKPGVDLSELHPLRHKWTFYFDAKPPPPRQTGESTPVPYTPSNTESGEYEAGLNIVGKFKTVEDFCRLFNWVKPPSKLERSSNYHLFKSDIKPMWEDPANANGGKWVITMRGNPALLDRCWSWLAMGLVGQELDDKDDIICGAVVSLRSKIDRIQLWIRQKDDVERVNAVGKRLVKLLDLDKEPGVQLEFQYNSDERVPPTKYISITPPQVPFRRGGPDTPISGGGAFGAFGQGRGAFGSGGRGSFGARSTGGGGSSGPSP